jgi:pimeloyl-ACP methyl ester carboxylesterase
MADGCDIKVLQAGHGRDALILLHGFGENSYAWGEPPPELTSAYTILAVDLRGHGDSSWDSSGNYHFDKFVADVAAVIDRLNIGHFAIAGHSLGAGIALEIAVRRQRQVTKLILVEFGLDAIDDDVMAFTLEQFNSQFRIYASVPEYTQFLETQRPLADRSALLRYSSNSVRRASAGGYEMKCDPAVQNLYRGTHAERFQRQRADITQLSSPLLVVRGSGSAIVKPAAARELGRLVPGAQMAVVPGAGHAVMMDRPKAFNETMFRYLLIPDARQVASALAGRK